VADGARHRVLGGHSLSRRLGDAAARADCHRDSRDPPPRDRRRHRAAPDLHRPPQRRPDRTGRRDDGPPRHARLPFGAPAARPRHRGGADAARQPARLSRVDRRRDAAGVGARVCEASGTGRQPARLFLGRVEARRVRRAAPGLLPAMVSILFTDLFDSLSTFIGVATAAGSPKPTAARSTSAAASSSMRSPPSSRGSRARRPATAYVESIAGIRMGGRTARHRSSPPSAFCPASSSRRSPPRCRRMRPRPVLVLVGVAMFQMVSQIDFTRVEDALPAFVTLVLIPLDVFDHAGHPVLASSSRRCSTRAWGARARCRSRCGCSPRCPPCCSFSDKIVWSRVRKDPAYTTFA